MSAELSHAVEVPSYCGLCKVMKGCIFFRESPQCIRRLATAQALEKR